MMWHTELGGVHYESLGQELQVYFQNKFENFMGKFSSRGQVERKLKKKKDKSNRNVSAGWIELSSPGGEFYD